MSRGPPATTPGTRLPVAALGAVGATAGSGGGGGGGVGGEPGGLWYCRW